MPKPSTQKDLIADWLKNLSKEAEVVEMERKNIREKSTLNLPDPGASPQAADYIKPATVYLYVSENKDGGESRKDYMVGMYWNSLEGDLFQKTYPSEEAARMGYTSLQERLKKVESISGTDPEKSSELMKDLLEDYKMEADPLAQGKTYNPKTMSSLQNTILPGWEIINSDGRLLVKFSPDFLKASLRKFESLSDLPAVRPEVIYSTATRLHCGVDNYLVSRWRKALTKEGNIVRNIIQIEKENAGERVHFVLKNVSDDQFDTICSSLTPDQGQYGLNYDSITGLWYKTAGKSVIQNIFFDNMVDLKEYLDSQKSKSAPEAKEEKPSKKEKLTPTKEEKSFEPEKEHETEPSESVSFEELMEKPAAESKEEPIEAATSLKESKLNFADIKVGDNVVYMSEGKALEGTVESIKDKEVALRSGKTLHEHLEEEPEISYFMAPGEYRELKKREHAHNKEEKEKGDEAEWAFEESARPEGSPQEEAPTEEKEEAEEIKMEEEELLPEDLGQEEPKLAEEIASDFHNIFNVLSSLKMFDSPIILEASLKSWLGGDWPNGLPTPEMQKIYNHMLENFRNELREKINELHAKWLKSQDLYTDIINTQKNIEKYQEQIDKEKDEDTKKQLEKQQANLKPGLEKKRDEYRRAAINPESYKAALMSMFREYSPLSTYPPELQQRGDPAANAAGAKRLRELLQKEKELNNGFENARKRALEISDEITNKQNELWSIFEAVPEYAEQKAKVEAIVQKINKIDDLFADYLSFHGSKVLSEGVEKFQDTIAKLEKERVAAMKGVHLPPENQKKADDLISEIHSLQDKLYSPETAKQLKEMEKEMDQLEKQKYALEDEIGVVATLTAISDLIIKKS